jgi:hypothetical protein
LCLVPLHTPTEWIAQVFSNQQVLPLYYSEDLTGVNRTHSTNYTTDLGCIIEASNMYNKMIDFNATKAVDELIKGTDKRLDVWRDKPLFAMVRGSGGGKTRTLMEIRDECLRREGVLPIAITFNHAWDIWNDSLWTSSTGRARLCYALSVVLRMTSVMFGIFRGDDLVMQSLHLLDGDHCDAPQDIIRGMLNLLEDKVNEKRGGKYVKQIVVMLDECVMSEERALAFNARATDITFIARYAILYDKRDDRAGTTLVVSSLTLKPTGFPGSSSVTLALDMAQSLNVTSVVDNWFLT